MKNTDVELIQRVLEGDDTAFSELVDKYWKSVHALAWRKVQDFHIAEDIAQETFLRAYRRLSSLKEPHSFVSWLYVIATNQCKTWLSKKRLWDHSLEDTNNAEWKKATYSNYVIKEKERTSVEAQREVVKKLLAKLQESDRTVITLYYLGGMTYEEISKFLGVSVSTIKSRLYRARQFLKKEEPMIREALENYQITPNLTENIMQEISRLKPTPSTSKPLMPWAIAATSAVLILLMLGIGSQNLARFQKPYSLESQSETAVEIVDAPVVQNVDAKPDIRNQLGKLSDTDGKNNGDGEKANQVTGDEGDYTRWNLPEGAKQRLGKGVITGIDISPDNAFLAIASTEGIWLYDSSISTEIALLTGHTDFVTQVAFSPDSKTFVSTGSDRTIRLWESSTGEHLFTFTKPSGSFDTVKFSSDGEILLGQNADDHGVHLWNITTKKYLGLFTPKLPKISSEKDRYDWQIATAAIVDKTGGVIFAVANEDGTINIQEGHTGRLISTLPWHMTDEDDAQYFDLKGRGQPPLSGEPYIKKDADGIPFPIQDRVHRPHIGGFVVDEPPIRWVTELSFAPDGKTLVGRSEYREVKIDGSLIRMSTSGGPTALWDIDTGKQLAMLRRDIDIDFSSDGKTLTITGDGGFAVWDIIARREISVVNRKEFVPAASVVSSNGTILFTVNQNGIADIWETKSGKQVGTFTTGYTRPFTALAFTHDGATLAAGDISGGIQLWDLNTGTIGKVLKSSHMGFHRKVIRGLAFATDNATLTNQFKGNIEIWNVTTGKQVDTYTLPQESWVNSFSTKYPSDKEYNKWIGVTALTHKRWKSGCSR